MTQPAKVQEPSMEEILASIRRIIADDEAKPAAAEKPASPAAAAKPGRDEGYPAVGDCAGAEAGSAAEARRRRLRRAGSRPPSATTRTTSTRCWRASMRRRPRRTSGRAAARGRRVRTHRRDGAADAAIRHRRQRRSTRSSRRTTSNSPKPRRHAASRPTSRRRSRAAAPAQQILSHSTVSAVESAFNSLANTVLSNNARTLEDLVKEMLRPMLKSWLDDNLPGLVERIVKAEIERVSRGGALARFGLPRRATIRPVIPSQTGVIAALRRPDRLSG